ncbi:hypothetical protein DIS24_g6467 [Lasiodiplodia hormozganensis]|uniref:Uncharacterized protein n=1 Tax=Lasiodiplodia hormozganensis TaxID=869390 RepID=A0AA39YFA3_9PEZI|nr:hypothetical protein DIS24_g6467 [Lasiodiplodia hormozganensis]
MQNHRRPHSDASYSEHAPTARGPLADFARTPFYPPPPHDTRCAPTSDGRCICGASSSSFRPEYSQQVTTVRRPVRPSRRPSPLFSYGSDSPVPRSNPFTDEEPDYSSILPGFAQNFRPTAQAMPVNDLGSSGLPSDESPSSAYSNDRPPIRGLVPFDYNGERYYPETTRRPTPLDQAQAEVVRMLHSQSPLAPLSTPPLRPVPSPSDGDFDVPLLLLTPPSLPRPSRNLGPDAERVMEAHRTLTRIISSEDAGGDAQPYSGNIHVGMAIAPSLEPVGLGILFPKLTDEQEPEPKEIDHSDGESISPDEMFSFDQFFAGFNSVVEPASPQIENLEDELSGSVPEEEEEEEEYDTDSADEAAAESDEDPDSHMFPGILQPPYPAAPDGVNPQPMWAQVLTSYDLLDTRPDLSSDLGQDFLAVMRDTDLERAQRVSDIKDLRYDLNQAKASRKDSAWNEPSDPTFLDGDSEEGMMFKLMHNINKLFEHDTYHWPMLTPLEYGMEDEHDQIVPDQPLYMAHREDWNTNFDWLQPFAPRRSSRSDDEDQVPLSPKSEPIAWNPDFNWSEPFAPRSVADDELEVPLSPKSKVGRV